MKKKSTNAGVLDKYFAILTSKRSKNIAFVAYFLVLVTNVIHSLYQYGYSDNYFFLLSNDWIYHTFGIFTPIALLFYVLSDKEVRIKRIGYYLYSVFISLGIIIALGHIIIWIFNSDSDFWGFIAEPIAIQVYALILFLNEVSRRSVYVMRFNLGPSKVLVFSFLLLIVFGALLLLLPNASHINMTFIDALFMSASAVCITGLAVVDVGTDFTFLGQFILMFLFQLGGIGIMTLTSFFAFFFQGGGSFQNQLYVKDFLSSSQLSNLFGMIVSIILLTFMIEGVGAVLIYSSLDSTAYSSESEKVFYAIFHSISAFCNAGFSLKTDGIYDIDFRFNYFLQLTIIALFIIGGLGFGVVFNLLKYIKAEMMRRVKFFMSGKKYQTSFLLLNLNSQIVIITTVLLIISGTLFVYVAEYNNTLSEHGTFGKLVTALFTATTPRTAGFNSVNMAELTFPTIMLVLLLMWIGASPGSTGGGIKTTTFAVAVLNFMTLAREKSQIEVFGRKVSDLSIRRTLAVITLSLLVIGLSIMFLSIFDGEKELLSLAFECFSAYSTVGLSLGITADLSSESKFVLIVSMFVGRVGAVTILIAMIRRVSYKRYSYPEEEIFIN